MAEEDRQDTLIKEYTMKKTRLNIKISEIDNGYIVKTEDPNKFNAEWDEYASSINGVIDLLVDSIKISFGVNDEETKGKAN
jgi:hypothetical protein